ncbi:two component transcriptional regulator, LuxR family [Candidatus Koribacter versatilis Ellin345]|uniref:Two component transcriptional regulator, LuxR family n=2 Tax=Candidatus Korobacter versatilis TaxID=658062 RepID=Q1IJ83_KORVE|nr:two component transcriptional regulator, LuxR family [Candidatus Koribacter versatilis Ellin345]
MGSNLPGTGPYDDLSLEEIRMNRTRILLADDHNLVAELCKKLLETEYEVVGIATDGRALVRAAVELKPDVIIADVGMPLLNGLDAAQQVKQKLPTVKIIFLTMNPDPDIAAEAFRRGASAYLVKTSAASEVVASVREVLRGKTYVSPTIPREMIDLSLWQHKKLVDETHKLTDRQREVLQLLAEGKGMKEVAAILNMTTRTVAFHKYRIMEVLGTKNNADLVKYAVRNRMTSL